MQIKNREQFLITLTVGAGVLWVLVYLVYGPLQKKWSARSLQIQELREKVKTGKTLVARETGIRSHWAEMQTNSLASSTSAAEQQLLQALDGWARESGAELTSIMPQWKNDSTNYMTLACRVEAAGDIGSLSRLIYAVEKGPLAVKLDSMEMSSRDASGQQMTLGLELNGLALIPHDTK